LDAIHDHLNNNAMERITWIIIWYVTIFHRQNLLWNELQAYRGSLPCGIRELIDPLHQYDADHVILQGEVVARLILHATTKSKPPVNITREEAMRVLGMLDLE
jgi:hypothetical protein